MRHAKLSILLRLWPVVIIMLAFFYFGARPAQAACGALAGDKGQDKGTFSLDQDGEYALWLRMRTPKAAGSSVYLQVDSQCPVNVGDANPASGFQWVSYRDGGNSPTHVHLTSGLHAVTLAGHDAGMGVDEVLALSKTDCTPKEFGANCLDGVAKDAVGGKVTGEKRAGSSVNSKTQVPIWRALIMVAAVTLALASTSIFLVWLHHFRKPYSRLHNLFITELTIGVGRLPHIKLSSRALSVLRHPKLMIIIYSVVMAIALVAAAVAAQPGAPVFQAEEGALSGGAKIVEDTTASGGKYVVFEVNPSGSSASSSSPQSGSKGGPSSGSSGSSGSASPSTPGGSSSSCVLPKYPTPSCTGTPSGTQLTTINGEYDVTTDGAVIDGKHITGDVIILANNVTIKNSQIDGTIYNDQGSLHGSFTVIDTTIGPASGCIGQPAINDSNYTATRVLSRGHDDGFRIGPPGNVAVYDSYVDNCYLPPAQAPPDGSHSDGVQAVCGGSSCSGVTIIHNTFDGTHVPTTNMLNLTDTDLSNVLATDNLLAGGAYVIDAWWHSGPTWIINNNRIVNNSWAYGAVTTENTCGHQSWSGNKLVTIDSSYNITSTVGHQDCVE